MRAFLIAGEASGDRLGAGLMAGIKSLAGKVDFDGIGGALMQDEGLASRFPMDELTLFGIAEVLPAYRRIKRRIAETAKAVIDAEPDVLVTIDSPDFCLRVAKLVKAERSTRIVHYVAPSVWAWRPGRAAKMAASVDQVFGAIAVRAALFRSRRRALRLCRSSSRGRHSCDRKGYLGLSQR